MNDPHPPTAARRGRLLLIGAVAALLVAAGALFALQRGTTDLRADAAAAAAAGRIDEAIIGYKSLLQQDAKDFEARRALGRLYLATNAPKLALKELRRASPLREQYPDLDLDIARAQLALGAHREALAALRSYRGPPGGEIAALEATARAALGEKDEAKKVLASATEREPATGSLHLATARLALSERDFDGALAAVDKALAATPDADAAATRTARLLKGQILLAAQRPADAVAEFEQVTATKSDDVEGLAGLAEALLVQQRLDEATPVVERLRKAAPKPMGTRLLQGWLAYAKGDLSAADTALAEVLVAAPTHPGALLMAADSAFRQDKFAQAESLLGTFRKQYPDHLPADRLLAAVLLKQRRAPEAIALLEPVAAAADADAGTHALLGHAYFEAGDAKKGEAALAAAQRLAPDSTVLKAQRAVGRLMAGGGAGELDELEAIVDAAPEAAGPRQALTFMQLLGGDKDAALASARALVALRPKDPMAHNLLGVAAAEAGDETAARGALEKALAIDPAFAPALSTLGLLELRANHPAEGRARLEAALAADKRHAPAAMALAALASAEGREADADAILERFIADAPQASEPRWALAVRRLRAGARDAALALADDARQIAPALPRNRLLWSYVRLGAGKAEDAYTELAALHAEQPADSAVAVLYGDAARGAQHPDEARKAYARAVELTPTAVEPWRGLFALALEAGDVDAATDAVAKLRALGPTLPDGDAAAAALALQQGRTVDARAALQAAFDKNPVTGRLLQLVEVERASGEKAAAQARLDAWLEAHPADLVAREARGMSALQDGDLAGARDAFESLLKAQPNHAVALNNLAWLYDEAGDPRALDYAEKARARLPESPEAADTLGWILVRQGKVQRGLKLIEQAKARLDQHPSVHWHHAWALDAAGEKAAALDSVERLLEKHPQFPERADAERLRSRLQKKEG